MSLHLSEENLPSPLQQRTVRSLQLLHPALHLRNVPNNPLVVDSVDKNRNQDREREIIRKFFRQLSESPDQILPVCTPFAAICETDQIKIVLLAGSARPERISVMAHVISLRVPSSTLTILM
jgi:hypothetical protein